VVRKGDILYNPVSGETLTFLKTSADTQGHLLQIDVSVEPAGGQHSAFVHIHPRQQEKLCIRTGSISLTLHGEKHVYGPGETVLIPAGTPHQWKNASSQEELHFICELRPAMHWEAILETVCALSQAGKLAREAAPPLLQLALTLNKYPHHLVLSGTPAWLQQALFKILAPLALLLGHSAELDYKSVVAAKSLPGLTHPG
jgi:quercetin dioxygenase-like cupin family protein